MPKFQPTHAIGRNRLFLPWVFTTFGGIGPARGPAPIWHYIDTIYASSAALARQALTSRHAVAVRKAAFLASLQAVLTRSCFAMLTTHTSPHAARPAAATGADVPPPPPPSPPLSRATTPDPDAAADDADTDDDGDDDDDDDDADGFAC